MTILKSSKSDTKSKNKSDSKRKKAAKKSSGTSMQKTDPAALLSPFEEIETTMERMFERLFPPGWHNPWRETLALPELAYQRGPKVDVIDRDGEIVVRAELPGIAKKDLDVTVADDSITIRGACREEEATDQGTFYRREISSSEFARTLVLPSSVDSERAKASFKNGVLELILEKVPTATRRSLTIE